MKQFFTILFLLALLGCGLKSAEPAYTDRDENYDGKKSFGSLKLDTAEIGEVLNKGTIFLAAGEVDSAIALFNRLYTRSNVFHSRLGMARALEGLGKAYFRKGEIQESTRYLELSIRMLEDSLGLRGMAGRLYTRIAGNFQTQGHYSASIIYCYKALDYLDGQPGELKNLAEAYSTMGGLWVRLGERSQAIHYLMLADSLGKSIGYNYLLALNSIHLGSCYSGSGRSDSSLIYYQASLKYLEREGKHDVLMKAAALTNISRIFYEEGRFREAGETIRKVDSLTRENNSPAVRAIADMAFAFACYHLDSLGKAAAYYRKVLDYALPDQQADLLIPTYQGLVSVYEKSGNYKEASRYQKELDTLRQINEKVERGKTVDLLLKYHLARKNEELSRQQLVLSTKESQLKGAYIWLMIVIVILIILVSAGIHLYRMHQQRQKLQQSLIQNIRDKQALGNLQALMEGEEQERNRIGRALHDGIMIQLSAVKMQLNGTNEFPGEKQKSLLDNVSSIIREVRFTAHNLMPDWLLEDGLGDALRYFCNSIEPNYGIRVLYHQNGNIPRFHADFEISIYRIVQELVQNIIKHAQSPKALVELSYIDRYLHLVVEDNGTGFDVDRLKVQTGSRGMGLISIKRRVKALNGKIELQSHDKVGTTIYMEFNTMDIKPGGTTEDSITT